MRPLNAHSSILERPSFSHGSPITPIQARVDGLVGRFVEEAANPRTLAAIMAGGMANRLARVGVMGLGSSMVLRPLSVVVGLGAEVTTYELTRRSLISLSLEGEGRGEGDHGSDLWSWSGHGGWCEGLITSAITFGMLKGAGHLAREQNLVLQHAFQSTAMVAGHQTAGVLGVTPRPEGSLAEQFLHAEATNLQLGAGMALAHSLAPVIHSWERGLDLSLRNVGMALRGHPGSHIGLPLRPDYATAGNASGNRTPRTPSRPERNPSWNLMMTARGAGGGSSRRIEAIYQSAPPSVQNFLDLNESMLRDIHPHLRQNRLQLLALTLAESLNDTNQILNSSPNDLDAMQVNGLIQARNWIRDKFGPFLSEAQEHEFGRYYRQALSSVSLPWVHEDILKIPLSTLRLRVQGHLEKIQDQDPFHEDLPKIVFEIGEDWGQLHRQAYLAIVSYGLSKGWIDSNEPGAFPDLVKGFRLEYQLRYPQGSPPIRPDFIQTFLSTAAVSVGLRQKWGKGLPILQGFDHSMEVLGLKESHALQRYQMVRRVQLMVSDNEGEN